MSRAQSQKSDSCYFCDSAKDIETHHIVPRRFRGQDSRENLVDVCRNCHWKLERLYNKQFYNALGIEENWHSDTNHIVCDHHECHEQASAKFRLAGDSEPAWYCLEHKEWADESGQHSHISTLGGSDE